MRQIVLDVETTGLDASAGHRIIEIGCVELVNRRPTGQKFHRYLNPEREIDAGALGVHGIELAQLMNAPRFGSRAAPQAARCNCCHAHRRGLARGQQPREHRRIHLHVEWAAGPDL